MEHGAETEPTWHLEAAPLWLGCPGEGMNVFGQWLIGAECQLTVVFFGCTSAGERGITLPTSIDPSLKTLITKTGLNWIISNIWWRQVSDSLAVECDGEEGSSRQGDHLLLVLQFVVVVRLSRHRRQRHLLHELTCCVCYGHQAGLITVLYHLLYYLKHVRHYVTTMALWH